MLTDIQKAIAGEQLDGWLFFNFLHRDPLSDRILGLSPVRINSRPWYYLVPAKGQAVKICNAVEPVQLDSLPGKLEIYTSRSELIKLLSEQIKNTGPEWGAQFSTELTAISTLDYGTGLMLQNAGFHLHSSSGLIQRLCGLIDKSGIKSHETASTQLYEIVGIVWNRISEHFSEFDKKTEHRVLKERDVQQWILEEFKTRGMISEHMPIVACGINSGNPHYATEEHDNPITPDSVIQLDLWAKFDKPGSIFADISWLGFSGRTVPKDVQEVFRTVKDARDRCADYIDSQLAAEKTVTGADADRETRKVMIDRGYGKLIKHRTGHGIDTNVHGSGAGLDSVEFPDHRPLLEGSCFSIEPGLYSAAFGMRTEINAYIKNERLKISGPGRQNEILTIK